MAMNERNLEMFVECWHAVLCEYQQVMSREHPENAAVEVVSSEEFEELMKKVEEA